MIPGVFAASAAVQGDAPPPGGFPAVQSITQTVFPTTVLDHEADMPAVVAAGDGLLMICTNRGVSGNGSLPDTPSGWASLDTVLAGTSGGRARVTVFWRVADGTEGGTTVNVETPTAQTAAIQAWRISGHGGTPTIAMSSLQSPADPDPPNLASGFTGDVLWITGFGSNGGAAPADWPANFGDNRTNTATGGSVACRINSCSRNLAVGTLDPGPFNMASNTSSGNFTIAVPPA